MDNERNERINWQYQEMLACCDFSPELNRVGGIYALVYASTLKPYYIGRYHDEVMSRLTKHIQTLNDSEKQEFRGHLWEFVLILDMILSGNVRWCNSYCNHFGKNIWNYFLDYWFNEKKSRCYDDGRVNWIKTKCMLEEYIQHGKLTAILLSEEYGEDIETQEILKHKPIANIEYTGTEVNRNLQKNAEEDARQYVFDLCGTAYEIAAPIKMEKFSTAKKDIKWVEYPNVLVDKIEIYQYNKQ